MTSPRYLSPEREAAFPNLRKNNYHVTSDEDDAYNCIAHAAGKSDIAWWPAPEEDDSVFWPAGVPRQETLDAFFAAYGTLAYAECAGPELEDGYEKIALYATANGTPSHAARQVLPSGAWTSKLGTIWEDIEHDTLDAVNCPEYGMAQKYLNRAIGLNLIDQI